MKIHPVEAKFFCGKTDGGTVVQTDRWKDMTKLIIAFRSFENAPKKDAINIGG
jgi:hypothetical protein